LRLISPVDYYKIIIVVAVMVFIMTMVLFWYLTPGKSDEFPPIMSNCPINWSVNPDGTCNIPLDGVNMGNLNGKGKPIYKNVITDESNKQTTVYSTDSVNGGIKLTDLYGTPILAYTGPKSNTKFPHFPGGYDITHPEKNVVDFTTQDWSKNSSVLCANHNWAVLNNINWEGVSNYNQC